MSIENNYARFVLSAAIVAACASFGHAEAIVDGKNVTFRLDAREWDEKPKRVNVAGAFQGWNKDQNALTDDNGDGVWEVTVPVTDEGQFGYKFVIDGERWIADPTGDKELEIDDTYGGKNSGVIVGYDVRKAPPVKPDDVNAKAVFHNATDVRDADYLGDGRARIAIRVQAGDADRIEVVPIQGPAQSLARVGTANGLDTFAAIVNLAKVPGVAPIHPELANGPETELRYFFRVRDGSHTLVFDHADGNGATVPYTLAAKSIIDTPDWAKSAVWYQVFPERFRNGDPSNDPGEAKGEHLVKWTSDWWKAQPNETPGDENFYQGAGNVWQRRYGGDLQGMKQSLPYLRELGVNAIYFNPIFEAESMHKYDTADFRHIDDNFGVKGDIAKLSGETDDPATWQWTESDKLFLDFLAEAKKQGFKVIIDGVFNHTGRAHPFFQDVLEKGKNSKYADWFEITDWGDESNWKKMEDPYTVHGKPGGVQWKAWDQENGHLPVFKKDGQLGLAPGPRDHIMAITKRWLAPDGDASKGIDGWRLDVPGDIPHPFWIEWRKVVKAANPDAYITGEIWPWAQPWLNQGDQFDAVMNYQFAMPAQEFFINEQKQMKPTDFVSRLTQLQMAYPFEVALVQQNLYDSHDTDRLASMFVNPDRPYDGANRPQDNAASWPYSPAKPTDEQWTRLKQAAAVQFAYVGAPMIYYGTEAGMWSPDDPSNRQPMVWRELLPYEDKTVTFKADLFNFYQRLIAMRSRVEALQLGFYVPLTANDAENTLAFRRSLGDKNVYVVVNRSGERRMVEVPVQAVDADKRLINWLDEAQVKLVQPDVNANVEARPTLKVLDGNVKAADGKVRVTLPAYGTTILSAE